MSDKELDHKTLLRLLEEHREREGLTKTAIAKMLGAPSLQYYLNWVRRDSLPKEYIAQAQKILQGQGTTAADQLGALKRYRLETERKGEETLALLERYRLDNAVSRKDISTGITGSNQLANKWVAAGRVPDKWIVPTLNFIGERLDGINEEKPADLREIKELLHMLHEQQRAILIELRGMAKRSPFLSEPQLEDLTGYKQASKQIEWLKNQGVAHHVNSLGRVIVTWDAINQSASEQPRGPEPDFSSLL